MAPISIQLFRYGVVGAVATALHVLTYLGTIALVGMPPLAANLAGYGVGVAFGFIAHRLWSFQGHGSRRNVAGSAWRFFLVSLVGLGLNSLWVLLLVTTFGGPYWWPIPLMVVATPLLIFFLLRSWVFK